MDFKHRIARSSTQIRDDRGTVHRVRVANKRETVRAASGNGQAIWEEYRRIVRGFRNPLCHVLISGSCFALAAALATVAFSEPTGRWWLYFGGVGLLVYVGMRNPGWIRNKRDRLAGRLASCNECIACSYSLADIPAETDGCTVCPECGAAWRSLAGMHESDQTEGTA